MIGGGAVSRRELAHVALEALADERALALTLAEGRTPAADGLPAIDSSRDAAIQDLGLVMYRRPARPLQPPGVSRPTPLQSNEIAGPHWRKLRSRPDDEARRRCA